ncbi:MAG: OmpA family protein [Proteobacteria bacterium]|nr:OmpA family protein [Pseudomonadota bacterium]
MQLILRAAAGLSVSLYLLSANASSETATKTQSRTVRTGSDYSRPSGFGLNLFVGGDGAFVKTSSDNADESSKQGALYGGKALLTLVNRDLEIEGGGGYCVSKLQGDFDIVTDEKTGAPVRLENVRIQTQTAVAEFSARIRLNNSPDGDGIWSAGPTAAAYLGTNASFGPDTKKLYHSAIFVGGQLALEFGIDFKPRLILSYLTDLNLFERQVHIGMLSLQFGTGVFKPKTVVKDIRNQTNNEVVRKVQVEKPVQRTVVKENYTHLLGSEIVNFETDKFKLLKRSEIFLRELGFLLYKNPQKWTSLVIEGHTDIRGDLEYNNRLSLARANAVKDVLQRSGVPASRMRAAGFGPSRPLDPNQDEVALARNRRVELIFDGVEDKVWLRTSIQRLENALKSTPR